MTQIRVILTNFTNEMPECPICYESKIQQYMVSCVQCRKSICDTCEHRITTNKCPLCRFDKTGLYSKEDYHPISDEYYIDTYKTYASDYPDEDDLNFHLL